MSLPTAEQKKGRAPRIPASWGGAVWWVGGSTYDFGLEQSLATPVSPEAVSTVCEWTCIPASTSSLCESAPVQVKRKKWPSLSLGPGPVVQKFKASDGRVIQVQCVD